MSLQDSTDDVEEDAHAQGGDQQSVSTTDGFDEEQNENGSGGDLDDTVNAGSEQRDSVPSISNLWTAKVLLV